MEHEENYALLPNEPDDKLKYGMQLIQEAFKDKVDLLKKEIDQIKEFAKQQRIEIEEAKESNKKLEDTLLQREKDMKKLEEEKMALRIEKEQLVSQVKKMTQNVSKLQNFKRAILSATSADKNEEEIVQGLGDKRENDSFTSEPSYSPQIGKSSGPFNDENVDDGKEFFKKAKEQLTVKKFNTFLASIKQLNLGKQTKAETLAQAKRIFGEDNSALYVAFENLLLQHVEE